MNKTDVDWSQVESEFLCTYCHELLYTDIKLKIEYCLTPTCENTIPSGILTKTSSVLELYGKEKAKLNLERIQCSQAELTKHVYQKRAQMLDEFYSNPLIPIDFSIVLALGELLTDASSMPSVGRKVGVGKFEELIKKYINLDKLIDEIEDIENYRNVIGGSGETLLLKYWPVFQAQWKNFGIISRGERFEKTFQYNKIERGAQQKFSWGQDFSEFFKENFTHCLAVKYAYEKYYRTKKQHEYAVEGGDIATFFGLFYLMKTSFAYFDKKSLERQLRLTLPHRKINDFLEEYSGGKNIPIFINVGNGLYLFHKFTLLHYIFYLVGIYSPKSKSKTIQEAKESASKLFEEEIRNKFRKNGWIVVPEPVKLAEEKYEYDIVAIKADNSAVCLVEAKFHDMPPSAISGQTLLKQQLYSEDQGALPIAIKQVERLNYFTSNIGDFKKKVPELSAVGAICKVFGVVVTKWKPLINRYGGVLLSSFDEEFIPI